MTQLRIGPPDPPPLPRGRVRLRYGRFDRLVIDDVAYMVCSADTVAVVLVREDNERAKQTLSHEQLNVLRHSRGYRHDRDFYLPELAQARIHAGVSYVSDLPDEEQAEVLWKQKWCLAAIRKKHAREISYSDESLETAIPIIATEIGALLKTEADGGKRKRAGRKRTDIDGPSPKCLRDWINDLIEGNMNPLALRRKTRKCGNRTPRLEAEEYAFLFQYAAMAAMPEKETGAVLWRKMSAAIETENKLRRAASRPDLVAPSYERLLEEIDKIPFFDMMAGREGVEKAKNYVRALTRGLADVVRPLQRVEFDEWTVHLHVLLIMTGVWATLSDAQKEHVKTIRLVLCIALDVATKCVVGMSLARTASPENAFRCLEMAVSDKQDYADAVGAVTPWDIHGTMETSAADAGSSFANDKFRAMNIDLGVKFMTTVAGLPWLRGNVERIFRSTDDKFVALFAGRTFSDTAAKGDYDSEGRACLTIDEFAEALVRYKIDHYHNHEHDGLAGETPRSAWLRLTAEFGVDAPPDDHLRRVVFGKQLRPVLGAHGLRVLGIDYQSEELNQLFCEKGHINVDVRVDLQNLGGISAKVGEGWLLVEGAPELYRVTAKDWIAVWDEFQARNAAINAITRQILDDTMAHLVEVGKIARERRNIAQRPMSAGEIQHHQRRMSIGASFVRDRAAAKAKGRVDLLEGALVVGGVEEADEGQQQEAANSAPADTKAKKHIQRPRKTDAAPKPAAKNRRARWKWE
jgi:putative transposase